MADFAMKINLMAASSRVLVMPGSMVPSEAESLIFERELALLVVLQG